ncbi:MAG: hypothetical protein AAFP76_14875, partial [Bacteroidota bacterium]
MKKVKAWIAAARIRTLPLSISGIIVGSAFGFDYMYDKNATVLDSYVGGSLLTGDLSYWKPIVVRIASQNIVVCQYEYEPYPCPFPEVSWEVHLDLTIC